MDQVRVIYTLEDLPAPSLPMLFLAGPTPRHSHVESWRPQALRMIRRCGHELAVCYPEPPRSGSWDPDGVKHIRWERQALARSQVILFWVPRNLKLMPAFRTNTEWGFWTARNPDKLVLGFPPKAPGMRGMADDAEYYGIPVAASLSQTVIFAVQKLFSIH